MHEINGTPVLWIDHEPFAGLLNALTGAKGQAYFAPSKQGVRYGITVSDDLLPNGLSTVFSVGTADNEGVRINCLSFDKNDPAVRGEDEIKVNGKTMNVEVMVRDKGEAEVNGETVRVYTLKPAITNKATKKVWSRSEAISAK